MAAHESRVSALKLVFLLSGISVAVVMVSQQLMGGLREAPPARYDPLTKTFVGVAVPPENLTQLQATKKPKVILYWASWFGGKWAGRFTSDTMEGLREGGCPEWRCEFTYDRARLAEADAVLFPAQQFGSHPAPQRPSQRWVWVDVESPMSGPGKRTLTILRVHRMSPLVNWTMTYHSNSDIMAFYGYFRSLNTFQQPLRPNFIENHQMALSQYLSAMAKGMTLEDLMGPSWRSFVERPQVVAWMSSHCGTLSKREDYVQELSNYVPVGRYGRCGQRCGGRCWVDILSRNYTFYMALENSWCDEYVTEKLYMPLANFLIPVVWGASNYSKILPPNSYIDARDYHPKQLAQLLVQLRENPVALGRYHVWRGFWEVRIGGTFCELCLRLHTDGEAKHHADVPAWRGRNGRCQVVPRSMFAPGVNAWRRFIKSNYSD